MSLSSFLVHCLLLQGLLCSSFDAAQMRKMPTDCRNISDIAFLAFYPACDGYSAENLEQCDLLSLAAIDLAVERMNLAAGILPRGSVLRTIPVTSRRLNEHGSNVPNPMDRAIMVRLANNKFVFTLLMYACTCSDTSLATARI